MMFLRFLAVLMVFLAVLLLPISSSHAVPNLGLPEGYALDFEGVDDYAHVNPFRFITGNSPVTVEAWIYPRSSANPDPVCTWLEYGVDVIIARGKSYHDQRGDFVLRIESDGRLHPHLYADWWDHFRSENTVELNAWTHVAVVYDGWTMSLYLNGEQDPNILTTGKSHDDSENTHEFRLGAGESENDTGPRCSFDGAIDEVRVWNVARMADEIRENMRKPLGGDEPGLVAYWRLDEGQGQIFQDATGSHYDGELGSTSMADARDPTWVAGAPLCSPLYDPDYDLDRDGDIDVVDIQTLAAGWGAECSPPHTRLGQYGHCKAE